MHNTSAAEQMQAQLADLIETAKSTSSIGQLLQREGVSNDSEFQRIDELPRREYTEEQEELLVEQLSRALKTLLGTQKLRAHQAIALYEAFAVKGLFCPLRAGGGKTLISFLAARCMGDGKRVLLLVPAKLKNKTLREMQQAAYHWDFPAHMIRVESYETLSLRNGEDMLNRFLPGIIIADECHKLRNKGIARTKKIQRYGEKHKPAFIAMSGTITKRSLKDYAHIIEWCLGIFSPLPTKWKTLEQWASAVDETTSEYVRFEPGTLLDWVTQGDWADEDGKSHGDQLKAVRRAVGRRFRESVGWVQARENQLGTSLIIEHQDVQPCDYTLALFEHINKTWTTPNGWPIADGLTFYRHRREVSQGFFYKWDPYPPQWWIDPRKAWAAECRAILSSNRRGLDSEAMVVQAVAEGQYPGPARTNEEFTAVDLLSEWRLVRDQFELNTVPVWFSNFMVNAAEKWAKENVGIVWVEHVAVGDRLADVTGLPYYGSGGVDAKTGREIESEGGTRSVIASIASNYEGRNLQMFHANWISSQPHNGPQCEQLYARTHRDGQLFDEVNVVTAMSCIEHAIAYHRSRNDATYTEDTLSQDQRILYANDLVPGIDEFSSREGANWSRT